MLYSIPSAADFSNTFFASWRNFPAEKRHTIGKTNRHAAGGITDKPCKCCCFAVKAGVLQENLHNKTEA